MKKIKVTLVVPNFRWADWDANTLWQYIPYNLCLLAAMQEDICDVNILDAQQKNMNADVFKRELERSNPDIVGITVLMDQYAAAGHKAAMLAKSVNPDIAVVMGGVYATMNPLVAMKDKNVDYVVIGEGEYVFRELAGYFMNKNSLPKKGLCYRINGKVINQGHADFIEDLDSIPFPAYHLIDFAKYANSVQRKSVESPKVYPYARIFTSRGCPMDCVFCQVESIMGKRFRARTAKNILDEIQFLKEIYGIKSLIFDDDNLFMDKKRAKEVFQGLIDRGLVMSWFSPNTAVFKLDEEMLKLMRESGCIHIGIAIESMRTVIPTISGLLLVKLFDLPDDASILDVGCGKGFLLYEFKKLLPKAKIKGFDISQYAVENAKEEVRDSLFCHLAQDHYPFKDKEFDLVISLNTIHNLYIYDLKPALQEIERVGTNKYIVVESYRNVEELFNVQCWALTCELFFTPEEWVWLYKEFGYTGDYEFIYF